jgi:hypothetical protein
MRESQRVQPMIDFLRPPRYPVWPRADKQNLQSFVIGAPLGISQVGKASDFESDNAVVRSHHSQPIFLLSLLRK